MKQGEKHPLLKRVIVFCLVTYLSVLVVVGLFQRRLIFFPTHEHPASEYESWNENGMQIGWKRTVGTPKHIWFFLHGNTGNVLTHSYILKCIPKEDSVYAVEYPGYGFRDGKASKQSIDTAADEAFSILREKNPGTPIVVLGESLGSGPASHLARHEKPPEKIILAVPFDNLPSVAQGIIFFLPSKWMLMDRWDNIQSLRNYTGKMEIYALANDKVISVRHARKLRDAFPNAIYHEGEGVHRDWWMNFGILSTE